MKPDGEVESILPIVFLEEYKNATPSEKEQMAEIVKNHTEKVVGNGNGDVDVEKMWKLVRLEDIKSHVTSLEVANDVQRIHQPSHGNVDIGDLNTTSHKFQEFETEFTKIKKKVTLSHSKMSKKLASFSSTKLVNGLSSGIEKISNPINTLFLAKTVINGIRSNDTTSLAITGSQVGFQRVTDSTVALSLKLLSAASDVGKNVKYFGDVSGPIGAGADIGLSIFSLTTSIQRLNNATHKYEKYDAIADILVNSINVALTAAVTAITTAFPPAAPILIPIGILVDVILQLASALFKTGNIVNRINSEVKLLDFEKKEVFKSRLLDIFGTRKEDYIDQQLEDKRRNVLQVQHDLRFLQENINFLGIVFPSRTINYDGGCLLTKQHCALKNAWGCTRWEGEYIIGRGCDWGRPCPWDTCNYFTRKVGRWGYDQFRCKCSGARTTFGPPRSDSIVDFRSKKTVYWERSVPTDVANAVFQCKPGNLKYIDYKVSQTTSRYDYLCENAIGFLQPLSRRREGQSMLFSLEDGNDKIYLNGVSSFGNIFRMGNNGRKEFYGGSKRNDFLFDSSCTQSLQGSIFGGGATDGIIIGDTCAKGQSVTANFTRGSLSSSRNNVVLSFSSIEEFSGRKNQPDVIHVACSTRQVNGRGGTSTQLDEVIIPNDTRCLYNLTVLGSAYTKVTSQASKGAITIPIDNPWQGITLNLDIHPRPNLTLNVIFLNTSSSQITSWYYSRQSAKLSVTLQAVNQQIRFALNMTAGETSLPVYFTESPQGSPNSVLLLNKEDPANPLFYHALPPVNSTAKLRVGSKAITNVFEITGKQWKVTGGDKDDEFILSNSQVDYIDGGKGIDTLRFHQDFNESSVIVDLESGNFSSIENLYGVPGLPLIVRTSCDSALVTTQGGSNFTADLVTVPGRNCGKRNLQIIANGNTQVVVEGGAQNVNKTDVVQVIATGNNETNLNFELTTNEAGIANLFVAVVLSHKNWTAVETKSDIANQSIFVHLEAISPTGNKDQVRLNVKQDFNGNIPYFPTPYIQLSITNSTESPGTLLIDRVTAQPKVMFQLSNPVHSSERSIMNGVIGLENIFLLSASHHDWQATGGYRNDLFVFTTKSGNDYGHYSINGNQGENTLLIENGMSDTTTAFLLNIKTKEASYYHNSSSEIKLGTVANIQHVIGREDHPDIIYPNCETKSVNGRGGRCESGGHDIVFIQPDNCQYNLLTAVGKHTIVNNTAAKGNFTYHIEDMYTGSLHLLPGKDNLHMIKISANPWEIITSISFNISTHEMTWKLRADDHERTQRYKLFKQSQLAAYSNPVFVFHPEESSVSSDIQVTAEGVTMATFIIQGPEDVSGLPVHLNRFLVNISTPANLPPGGEIRGSPDSTANQFWILRLDTNLELLDGGACQNSGCTNYLHFTESEDSQPLHVDLDINNGSVTTANGTELISRLQNIHELHGTQDITAHVTCGTKQVSGVNQVYVMTGTCPLDLIIGLEDYTKVYFQKTIPDYLHESDFIDQPFNSTVHYRFSHPMSFKPEGDIAGLLYHNHIYYLPFNLDSLTKLEFDLGDDRLFYTINNATYNFSMITAPSFVEQFYAQPSIITADAYRIQTARDGSIWTTMGNTSSQITQDDIPRLQSTANLLSATMVINTPTDFYFIGYSTVDLDRNMLQNVVNVTCHLAGGGANDTIYEIINLDNDVFIYSGFLEGNFEGWLATGNGTKQTIDLTDIIVPLRLQIGTKYVPKVESKGNNLIISMEGYEKDFPGKVVLVNGTHPWVAKRLQLLLANALVDLYPEDEQPQDGMTTETSDTKMRSVMSSEDKLWIIRPVPVLVPEDDVLTSISTEDLEDGHEIKLAPTQPLSAFSNSISNGENTHQSVYQTTRNGSDLLLTNIASSQQSNNIQSVIINDFFNDKPDPDDDFQMPKAVQNVKVHLAGLHLLLNQTTILNISEGESSNNEALVPELKRVLHEVEERLLDGQPEIERTYKINESLP